MEISEAAELAKKFKAYEDKIAALEKENEELKNEIAALTKLKELLQQIQPEMAALKDENRELNNTVVVLTKTKENLNQKFLESMSEIVRVRRIAGALEEERSAGKERIETLERESRNLRLWLDMNGLRKNYDRDK